MQKQQTLSSKKTQALFAIRKTKPLEQFILHNPEVNYLSIYDEQGNTLLHQLAFEGHLEIIKRYLIEAKRILFNRSVQDKKSRSEDQELQVWIDHKNNQGFTSLLYASYSGHLDIIKYLIEQNKANYLLKTNNGLNPLHLAAQKNMVLPFFYFRNIISINDVDDLKSTPLHWASYINSQEVVSYILSSDELTTINQKDIQGNTPLMLAVSYGNTRIVRRLLIKGANRYIQNSQNKISIDVARQSQFRTITKMLDEQFSICDFIKFYCNIKIQYKPKRRNYTVPILFLSAFAVNLAIMYFFISFPDNIHLYLTSLIFIGMFILYLSLLLQVVRNDKKTDMQIMQEYNSQAKIKKVCFQCCNSIPKRGYHCDICGVCVAQYDHHCTWINNCVGKKNIGRFIFFLVFLILAMATLEILSVLSTISIIQNNPKYFEQWFQLRYFYSDDLQQYLLLGIFLVTQVSCIFFFPVVMLFIVQVKNLLANKTTFQKSRGPVVEQGEIKKRLSKRKQLGFKNCRVMCTDNISSFTTNRSSFNNNDLITDQKFQSQRIDITYQQKQ